MIRLKLMGTALLVLASGALVVTTSGCECKSVLRAGLHIVVLDSITNKPILDPRPFVSVTGQNFSANQFVGSDQSVSETFVFVERAGVYRVSIAREGYSTWVRNLRVESDDCGPQTSRHEALLQPAPDP